MKPSLTASICLSSKVSAVYMIFNPASKAAIIVKAL